MKVFLPLFVCVCLAISSQAQTLVFHPSYQAKTGSSTEKLRSLLKEYQVFSVNEFDTSFTTATRQITLDIPGFAKLNFEVAHNDLLIPGAVVSATSGKRKYLRNPPLLYNGLPADKKEQVSLAIGKGFLMGSFSYKKNVYFIEPLRNLLPGAPAGQVVLYKESDVIASKGRCYALNSSASLRSTTGKSAKRLTAAPSERIVDLALAIDNTTFRNHNSNLEETVNYVTTVINLASALYRYSFTDSLRFRISEMIVFDGNYIDNYFEANTQSILNNLNRFSTWATTAFKKPFDLSGLWYYSKSAGDTIGLASFGTCNSRGNHVIREYGTTLSNMRTLVAHEMGHNFTAQHDAAGSPSIMAPSINGATAWSDQSKLLINYMLSTDETNCIMPPEVIISSGASTSICKGDTIHFNASILKPVGANPTYHWKVNNQPVGGNSSEFISSKVVNGDTISCDFTSEISGQLYSYWSRQYAIEVVDTAAPLLYTNTTPSFCSSDSIFLLTSGTNNFQWFKDVKLIDSGKSNILVVKTAGAYSVRTLNKGCLSNESQKLFTTVKPSPSKPVISLRDNLLHSSALAGNQWYLNDSIIPGATAPEYKPLTNGNYTVRATDGGCASSMSAAFAYVTTSIQPIPGPNNLTIGPNPVRSILYVSYVNNKNKMEIEILDAMGKTIIPIAEFIDIYKLDMSRFSKGVYFVRILNSKGSVSFSRKIIRL
jgi:hypothetical protein